MGWKVGAKQHYTEFTDWCKEDEGIIPTSNKMFGINIRKVIDEPRKNREGWFYHNYILNASNLQVTSLTQQLSGKHSNLSLPQAPGTIMI